MPSRTKVPPGAFHIVGVVFVNCSVPAQGWQVAAPDWITAVAAYKLPLPSIQPLSDCCVPSRAAPKGSANDHTPVPGVVAAPKPKKIRTATLFPLRWYFPQITPSPITG